MVVGKIFEFIRQARRVLNISYRPTNEEFNMTAKITAFGMVLIGIIGYIITLVFGVLDKIG